MENTRLEKKDSESENTKIKKINLSFKSGHFYF